MRPNSRMADRLFRFLGVLFAFLGASAGALAQVIPPETIDSVDAKVLGAKTVVVGTVAKVEQKDDGRVWSREVTFNVRETLKGEPSDYARVPSIDAFARLDAWKAG